MEIHHQSYPGDADVYGHRIAVPAASPTPAASAAPRGTFSFDQTKHLLDLQRKDYKEMMHVVEKMLSGQHNATQQGPSPTPPPPTSSSNPVPSATAVLGSWGTLSGWVLALFCALILLSVGLVVMFLLILKLSRRMKSASWLASILKEVKAEPERRGGRK